MLKPLPPVPVISELNDAQTQLLRNYLDELATRGIDVAPAEAKRLSPYLAALSDQLADDIRANHIDATRQQEKSARLQATFGVDRADYDETTFADKAHLQKIFNKIAKATKNVILSELMIVPSNALQAKARAEFMGDDTRIFSGDVSHDGLKYTLGFIQVKKDNGSVSVPVFAFDQGLMDRLLPYNPQVMLRAFQRVMTAGNHDMQHHYTNDILNPDIASTQKLTPALEEVSVTRWSNEHFSNNFGGDTDPHSYESWLMLNHASIRQRMDEGGAGEPLQAEQTLFFDELARIVAADEKVNGAESAHELLDYFAMGMMFALSRYRGIAHVQVQDALKRIEAIDPLPSEIIKYYIAGNVTPQPEGTSAYGHARLQHMQDMAPWALKLMAPELYDNFRFKQAQRRRGEIHAGMITAAASSASYFHGDGVYAIDTYEGSSIATVRNGKLQSIDGKPAVVYYQADEARVTEEWYNAGMKTRAITRYKSGSQGEEWFKDGQLHREDGAASRYCYADGAIVEKWMRHGHQHRDGDLPAYIEHSSLKTIQRWMQHGTAHRDNGPALIEEHEDGFRIEEWMQNGGLHRDGGAAVTEVRADGSIIESWCQKGVLESVDDQPAVVSRFSDGVIRHEWYQCNVEHRMDGPAVVEMQPDGSRLESWYIEGRILRLDRGPTTVQTLADGTRVEMWKTTWGGLHHASAPAQITTYPDGARKEEWFSNGQLHRDDAPAVIMVHADGQREEEWYDHGRKTDAPQPVRVIKNTDVARELGGRSDSAVKAALKEQQMDMFKIGLRDKIRSRLDEKLSPREPRPF